jgi:hypothetical protein
MGPQAIFHRGRSTCAPLLEAPLDFFENPWRETLVHCAWRERDQMKAAAANLLFDPFFDYLTALDRIVIHEH